MFLCVLIPLCLRNVYGIMSYCKAIIKKDKKSIGLDGKTMVYIQYTFDRKILRIKTGERVNPNHFTDGRITKGYGKDYKDANANIEIVRSKVDKLIREANYGDSQPTVSYIKFKYEGIQDTKSEKSKDLLQHLKEYIKLKEHDYTFNSLKDYKTLLTHLTAFKESTKYSLRLSNINNVFFSKFSQFLFERKIIRKGNEEVESRLMTNTVAKQFKILKVVMNWLTMAEKNDNLAFKSFKMREIETEVYYLTKQELDTLNNFTCKTKTLENVKNLFILQCSTGLRYSDIANLKPENIEKDSIKFRTIKTKDPLIIPLNEYSRNILSKYPDGKIPAISNQKANDYLKEIGKAAKLNRPIAVSHYYGKQRINKTCPLHEKLSTHVGRKTFVTLSLEFGLRAEVIMKMTGHKDYKTMKKYIAVSENSKELEMQKWNNLEK